jgi:hypothetical protein
MAVGESAGSVYVTIDGDASPLMAKFAQAQTSATSAGSRIASSFNAGATATDELASSAVAAAAAEARFATATEASSAALGHQVSQLQATSGAIRVALGEQSIRAAERFLTIIPGIGAALQVAFPVIGALALFGAISRVIGKSDELKASEEALQSATKAADESFAHMEETLDHLNVEHVKSVFGAAAGTSAEADVLHQRIARAKSDLQDLIDKIPEVAYAEAGAEKGGILSGNLRNFIPFEGNAAGIEKIKALGQQIKDTRNQIQELEGQAGATEEDAAREAQQQAGAIGSARVALQEAQLKHQAELNKAYSDEDIQQTKSAADSEAAALHNRSVAAVATAQAELAAEEAKQKALTAALAAEIPKRIALIRQQGAAEAEGKAKPEQQRIGIETQTKVEDVQAEADRKSVEQTAAVAAARTRVADATTSALREEEEAEKKFNLELAHEAEHWKDITAKASEAQAKITAALVGIRPETLRQQEKTEPVEQSALQRLQGGNSVQQQLALAIQLKQVGIDTNSEIQSRVGTLQAELAAAERLNVPESERLKIEQQILQALALEQGQLTVQQQTASAIAAARQTIQQNNQNVGQQLGTAIGNLPKSIGDDIGGAISNALLERHPGESIGQEMGKALVNALKSTAAGLLKQLISGGIQLGLGALGFAEGTDSAPGGLSVVGEKGPELMNVPRGAQVIPNHAIKRYADGTPGYGRFTSRSSQMSIGALHVHAHGVSNPGEFARQSVALIPHELKRQSSSFSPYSS